MRGVKPKIKVGKEKNSVFFSDFFDTDLSRAVDSPTYLIKASLNRHARLCSLTPRLEKKSCSTQLSMIFFLLVNVKMPIIVGILTFMRRKNSILGLSEPEKR